MIEALQGLHDSETIYRLGWTLVHSLWLGMVVAAGLGLGLVLLRHRSANTRYLASCAALVVLLAATVGCYFIVAPPLEKPLTRPVVADAVPTPHSVAPPADERPSLPRAVAPPGLASAPPGPEMSARTLLPVAPAAPQASTAAKVARIMQPALPWLVLIWAIGVLLLSIWQTAAWIAARRLCILGTSPVGPDCLFQVQRLARALRISRPVKVTQSLLVRVPTAIGFVRPVILLPASLLTTLSPAQLEAILAHELAHIRRFDYLVNLVQTAVETLLFYHPAVWFISRRIRRERENCCDDIAVAAGAERVSYAESLLHVARHSADHARGPAPLVPSLGLTATGKVSDLRGRIARLLGSDEEIGHNWRGWPVAAVIVTALTASILLMNHTTHGTPGMSGLPEAPPPATLGTPSATQPAASISFGPVVEAVVRVPSARDDTFLDLETGKLLAYEDSNGPNEPTMSKELSQTYRRARWAKGSGADICLPPDGRFDKEVTGLIGLDMRMLPTEVPFDQITPQDVAKALARRDFYMLNEMRCLVGKLPATFLVETREGHLGVVQVAALSDQPAGLKVRYKVAATSAVLAETPLWITMAPSEVSVQSLRELRVLAAVRNLNQEAGRSGEWEIRTADNSKRMAKLPYNWDISPDQLLPDGKRITGGTDRNGQFELDESQLRRVGNLEKGDYLLTWYVGGERCSNAMPFRIDSGLDPNTLPRLELAEIEAQSGRELPTLVVRARRNAEQDPALSTADVVYPTLNIDGQDRIAAEIMTMGPVGPWSVGGHNSHLIDLRFYTWDAALKQKVPPIDPGKPHVIFAKVGRDSVQQTPPVQLTYARTLGEAWDLATAKLAPVPPLDAAVALSGAVIDPQGKPGVNYEVKLSSEDGSRFQERADGSGRYRFLRIPPGTYKLGCNPPAMGQPELAFSGIVIQAAKRLQKDIRLEGKFVLTGRVTNAEGKPIPNMTIDLQCEDSQAGATFIDTTHTDEQGRYRLASPLGTVRYIGVNGGRLNGEMPRLSAGQNLVDFPADKGHFRAVPVLQPATQPAFETMKVEWHSTDFRNPTLSLLSDGSYLYESPVLEKVVGKDQAIVAMEPYRARSQLAPDDLHRFLGLLEQTQWLSRPAPAVDARIPDAVEYLLTLRHNGTDSKITLQDGRAQNYEPLMRFLRRIEHQEHVLFDLTLGDGPRFAAYLLGSELDAVASKASTVPVYSPVLDYRRLAPTMENWLANPAQYTADQLDVARKLLAQVKTEADQRARDAAAQPATPATQPTDKAEIDRLINLLGSDTFAEREAAQKALVQIGLPAVEALVVATKNDDAERAQRATLTLKQIRDPREFVRQSDHDISPGLTRQLLTQDSLPMLYDLLEDPAYRSYWSNIAKTICYLSDDPKSVSVIINYIRRSDDWKQGAIGVSFECAGKIKALTWLGFLGGEEAERALMKAMTPDGAKELTKAWINGPLPVWATRPDEEIVSFIQGSAAIGIVHSQSQQGIRKAEASYAAARADSQQRGYFTPQFKKSARAMAIRDLIQSIGMKAYLDLVDTAGNYESSIEPRAMEYMGHKQ